MFALRRSAEARADPVGDIPLAVNPPPPAAKADILVALHGVGIERAGRWLVRGIDLEVRRGEIVTLIGPNGSGKSTVAKAAIGIHAADEGRIERLASLRIGYVPQRLSVDATLPLTVERLLCLTSRLSGRERQAALALVGIGHLARAQVHRLSGGEFQRALLARAIARQPNLLVLDEPLQGVDFGGEIALYELIVRIRAETGCGILLISHDLHVVMAQTDTVICLNGHVCCRGTPQSVTRNPAYLALFGSRAAQALAIYSHQHDHTHLADGRIARADGSAEAGEDNHHGHEQTFRQTDAG